MFDIDTLNQMNREAKGQQKDEQQLKNKILAMTNTVKKQVEWKKYFPTMSASDDTYLTGKVF